MDYKELAKSLLCNGSGVGEDINGCTNKKCKYCDVDGACDLNHMCGDAAIAINELLVENQALRNAANGFKKQAEAAEARAEKAEREKNYAIELLRGICYACRNYSAHCHKGKCNNCKWDRTYDYEPNGNEDNWEWRGLED